MSGVVYMWAASAVLLVALASALPSDNAPRAVEVHSRGRIQAEVRHHPHQGQETQDDISFASSFAQSSDRRQLLRSEDHWGWNTGPLTAVEGAYQPSQVLQGAMSGGVAIGACKNFKKTGTQDVAVACPSPLKMVGCSCRDKEGENTGGCGTKFGTGETCNGFTKMDKNVTAYVRCCHMDWASNFSTKMSVSSGGSDGDGVQVACDEGLELLGCACMPTDAPNYGCKHNKIEETGCLATNLNGHSAGVKAQALCAVMPNSSDWETVTLSEHTVEVSTNLSCSKPYPDLQMISCSCGSSYGQCNGGKILANRCECSGARCFATGRCAKIPVPPRDCIWNVWGEWSDCSASCGTGQMNRIREIAMIAANGGADCTGSTNQTVTCKGDGTQNECNNTKTVEVVEQESDNTLLILGIIVCILTAIGGGAAHYHQQQKHQKEMQAKMGGEGGEYGEHGEYGEYGEGEWGAEAAGEESWGAEGEWAGEG